MYSLENNSLAHYLFQRYPDDDHMYEINSPSCHTQTHLSYVRMFALWLLR